VQNEDVNYLQHRGLNVLVQQLLQHSQEKEAYIVRATQEHQLEHAEVLFYPEKRRTMVRVDTAAFI
jgi:hypothetical protein